MKRSQFCRVSPRANLSISAVVLVTMPITCYLFGGWAFIAVWLFVISHVVVIGQGAVIVVLCGLQEQHGRLRTYGVGLILYGAGSLAVTLWLAALAAFGGPAGNHVFMFNAALWTVAVTICVPVGLYLRRRGDFVLNKPSEE